MVFTSRPSTSRTSAATNKGLCCTALSRASTPRRLWTSSQRNVPWSSRRATRSLNPMRMHFCNASSLISRGFTSSPSSFGDAEKLFEQRPDLPRGDGVDAQPAAGVEAELVLRRVIPRPHQNPEIRRRLFAQQILAERIRVAVHVAQQQIAALRERGDEAGLVDAAIFLRREQHARVTRMQRKREHLAADGGDL